MASSYGIELSWCEQLHGYRQVDKDNFTVSSYYLEYRTCIPYIPYLVVSRRQGNYSYESYYSPSTQVTKGAP